MPPPPAPPVEVQGRRIDVTASFNGYKPNVIPVKVGEQVTLVFTRTTPTECLEVVTIPSRSVKKDLPVGQPVAIPFKADKPGDVDVACGMDMVHATLRAE